jgi:archaellum component FlaC
MTALFVALGIAVLTLLTLMLWFVPHLLQQQALRSANESAQLRDMLLDMLNEQEAVTLRQAQLSSSMAHLQDQLEQVVDQHRGAERGTATQQPATVDPLVLRQIEDRIGTMQSQIQYWLDGRNQQNRSQNLNDNESWAHLMSLLAHIQERIGSLTVERANASAGLHARTLLEELEQEMSNLRNISEDIATLQWRLRRSLHERESNISGLRARSNSSMQ